MTNYARSAYGTTNPNAGYPANGNVAAWGGYKWPNGVPANLLGYTNYISKTNGQTAKVQMRKELVPLWNLSFQIMDVKWHYPVYSMMNGDNWGPWGYSNRSIAGTNTPSGHSVAVSVDINAPFNPWSSNFICDMPPGMVKDLESLFLYWGGRYTGKKYDPMHYGFCRGPSDVATAINKAKSILGFTSTPKPPPEDDMPLNDADKQWLTGEITRQLSKIEFVSTDDAAADGNPNKYTLVDGVARAIRLSSLAWQKLNNQPPR